MRGRVPGNRGGQRAISCKDRTRLLPGRTHLHGCSDADGRASARPAAYRRPRSPRANALSVLCRCSSTATPPPFMQIASASPSRPHTSHHVPSLSRAVFVPRRHGGGRGESRGARRQWGGQDVPGAAVRPAQLSGCTAACRPWRPRPSSPSPSRPFSTPLGRCRRRSR